MKSFEKTTILLCIALILSACDGVRGDRTSPTISEISTSEKVVVISDCLSTSITITANVSDDSNIKRVLLLYRVGNEGPFASSSMDPQNNLYAAKIKGEDLQGHGYGALEFYITAEDEVGNKSESPHDESVQFLPCVNN